MFLIYTLIVSCYVNIHAMKNNSEFKNELNVKGSNTIITQIISHYDLKNQKMSVAEEKEVADALQKIYTIENGTVDLKPFESIVHKLHSKESNKSFFKRHHTALFFSLGVGTGICVSAFLGVYALSTLFKGGRLYNK